MFRGLSDPWSRLRREFDAALVRGRAKRAAGAPGDVKSCQANSHLLLIRNAALRKSSRCDGPESESDICGWPQGLLNHRHEPSAPFVLRRGCVNAATGWYDRQCVAAAARQARPLTGSPPASSTCVRSSASSSSAFGASESSTSTSMLSVFSPQPPPVTSRSLHLLELLRCGPPSLAAPIRPCRRDRG